MDHAAEMATALIGTGNEKFMWIGTGLAIFQVMLLPVFGFLFKYVSDKNKKIVDLERKLTKKDRDAEFASVSKKIDDNYKDLWGRIEKVIYVAEAEKAETNQILESMNKSISGIGNKTNLLYEHFIKDKLPNSQEILPNSQENSQNASLEGIIA